MPGRVQSHGGRPGKEAPAKCPPRRPLRQEDSCPEKRATKIQQAEIKQQRRGPNAQLPRRRRPRSQRPAHRHRVHKTIEETARLDRGPRRPRGDRRATVAWPGSRRRPGRAPAKAACHPPPPPPPPPATCVRQTRGQEGCPRARGPPGSDGLAHRPGRGHVARACAPEPCPLSLPEMPAARKGCTRGPTPRPSPTQSFGDVSQHPGGAAHRTL